MPNRTEIIERLRKKANAFGAYGLDVRDLMREAADLLEGLESPTQRVSVIPASFLDQIAGELEDRAGARPGVPGARSAALKSADMKRAYLAAAQLLRNFNTQTEGAGHE